MLHHIGIRILTTPNTSLTRLTEKYSTQLGFGDFSGLTSTSDLDKYADFIVTAISTAIDRAISKFKSVRTESNPISNETLALIKEKRGLRRQYSQIKDTKVKTHIKQLQKQVKGDLRVETQASWEKFCNSISLAIHANIGAKSKSFSSPMVSATMQHCAMTTKAPR